MMSKPSVSRPASGGSAGRTALWISVLLTVALLSFITVLTAQHNPYLSDVARNKISRSRFIEQCKTQFDEYVQKVGKTQAQGTVFTASYDPVALMAGAVSNPDPKKSGWVLATQASVSRAGLGSQLVPLQCQSDDIGRVTLILPGAQGQ